MTLYLVRHKYGIYIFTFLLIRSAGIIAGIVIGSVLGVLLIGCCFAAICRHMFPRHHMSYPPIIGEHHGGHHGGHYGGHHGGHH